MINKKKCFHDNITDKTSKWWQVWGKHYLYHMRDACGIMSATCDHGEEFLGECSSVFIQECDDSTFRSAPYPKGRASKTET